ncbi:allatostatin-A receptor-like [Aplysia californica]|uniref:Allatostatin-A receptor-like n=1 Tax=Aplysia californica TaxID=6500 RepID=A0ABM0JS88_APLCA|nr:allatostatin-A receptor-like [Aplysia californica]
MHNFKTNNSSQTIELASDVGLVSDDVKLIFQVVNFAIVCEIIDVFGTVTNIINIIVFVKLGFSDPVNVSLLGLAISDLGCLVTLIWHNICFNPLFNELDLPFDPIDVQTLYLTAGWPHVTFTRITAWITAFITFERCLCIALPLKVKNIITPKRVVIVIVCLFIVLITSVSPIYQVNRIGPKFSPKRNKTVIGLLFTEDREEVEAISFAVNNVFVSFSAFFVVIVCTVTLVVKLRSKTKWRKETASAGKSDNLSTRDQKVTKMVTMISTLFIVCFIPVSVVFIGMIVEPEFSVDGQYRNLFFILCSFGYILESTNSALNILIYYEMSSKYRTVFNQTFRRKCGSPVKDTEASSDP